jgi:WD repeat and SOF domain-containing protein 1
MVITNYDYSIRSRKEKAFKHKNFLSNFDILEKPFYKKFQKRKFFLNKPFLNFFESHQDGIVCVQRHTYNSSLFFTGSSDGEIRFWITSRKKCVKYIQAHNSFVRKIGIDFKGKFLLSCSDDRTLKMWDISQTKKAIVKFDNENGSFTAIATHPLKYFFVTGGKEFLLWDQARFQPIQRLLWGVSAISSIKFNPEESNIACSSNSDRSLVLYDIRLNRPIKKFSLNMCSNDVSWNPSFFTEFTIANEDSNLYTFDIRNLREVIKIKTEHVMAILCLDSNLNNLSLISGSADNTIRFFDHRSYKNLDIYFSERMRRVTDLKFSLDGTFVLSGSDDGNLRMWKNNFTKHSQIFLNKAKNFVDDTKFSGKNFVNYSFFSNSYFLPKLVRNLESLKKNFKKKQQRKIKNKKKHNLPGYLKFNLKIKNIT